MATALTACRARAARALRSPPVAASSVPFYPGAFTPTEIYAAMTAGAAAVKVFPAGGLGPGYLRDIRGPLPGARIMPTGGIKIEDVADWLAAGAVAVGLGSPLIGDAASGGDLRKLAARARQAVSAVAIARS